MFRHEFGWWVFWCGRFQTFHTVSNHPTHLAAGFKPFKVIRMSNERNCNCQWSVWKYTISYKWTKGNLQKITIRAKLWTSSEHRGLRASKLDLKVQSFKAGCGFVRYLSFIFILKASQILYLLFLSYHQKVLLGLAILLIKIIYIYVINVNYVPKH